jgi:hypothetical protein
MVRVDRSPLDEIDEDRLYKLLGDAWYSQLTAEKGEVYYLPSSRDVGKREFEAVAPVLIEALRQPHFHGVEARVSSTLKVEASWTMPTSIIVALARRRGLIDSAIP